MKTFKQFQEDTTKFRTPKMYDDIPMTVDDAITGRIRTLDTINKSNKRFRDATGFNLPLPLAKRKYSGKINSDVLKSNPELDPNKPGDYIKLKRLSIKMKKA